MEETAREQWLEAQADALLAQAGRDPEYPAYQERVLLRKTQRARLRDLQRAAQHGLGAAGVLETVLRELKRKEIEQMFLLANLTPRERHICQGVARGETCQEIARRFGVTPQSVHATLRRARAKIAVVWKLSPYRGLWRLFSDDVHRTIIIRG